MFGLVRYPFALRLAAWTLSLMASKRPLERLLLIDRKISSALAMIVAATFFIGWRAQVLTQAGPGWRNFLALATLGIVKTSCRFMRICQACIVSRLAASSLTIEAFSSASRFCRFFSQR